jgi:hypothetical protein
LKNRIKRILSKSESCRNKDEVYLDLDGLEIEMNRQFAYDKPHEVSIFVPRAELRKKVKNGDRTEEIEILLNSITVVHSPQRPSNEGSDSPIEPPDLKPPEPGKGKNEEKN